MINEISKNFLGNMIILFGIVFPPLFIKGGDWLLSLMIQSGVVAIGFFIIGLNINDANKGD